MGSEARFSGSEVSRRRRENSVNKEEGGKGGGREGEIMDSSGSRGAFLKNWDRDPVEERSRARGLEEGRKKKSEMKKIREKFL